MTVDNSVLITKKETYNILSYIVQVTGEEVNSQIKRSWLLPILRESIRNTQLSFFIEYFLPLAGVSWYVIHSNS